MTVGSDRSNSIWFGLWTGSLLSCFTGSIAGGACCNSAAACSGVICCTGCGGAAWGCGGGASGGGGGAGPGGDGGSGIVIIRYKFQ